MLIAGIAGAIIAPAPHSHPSISCAHPVAAQEGVALAKAVWDPKRWQRGTPKPAAINAHRHEVHCAVGPGHRAAIERSWKVRRATFYRRRHLCLSAPVVVGRVSYFGGGLEASGRYTAEPGIALNIAPGSEAGWDNATTRGWLAKLQRFSVTIAGHSAVLPVTDLGPAGFTERAIDVTEGGVAALGLSGAFPTDAIGEAQLLRPGCS